MSKPFSTPGGCTPVLPGDDLLTDCGGLRGGTKTVLPQPATPLEAVNANGEILDLFEDETGSVVVDDAFDFLILNQ